MLVRREPRVADVLVLQEFAEQLRPELRVGLAVVIHHSLDMLFDKRRIIAGLPEHAGSEDEEAGSVHRNLSSKMNNAESGGDYRSASPRSRVVCILSHRREAHFRPHSDSIDGTQRSRPMPPM